MMSVELALTAVSGIVVRPPAVPSVGRTVIGVAVARSVDDVGAVASPITWPGNIGMPGRPAPQSSSGVLSVSSRQEEQTGVWAPNVSSPGSEAVEDPGESPDAVYAAMDKDPSSPFSREPGTMVIPVDYTSEGQSGPGSDDECPGSRRRRKLTCKQTTPSSRFRLSRRHYLRL